MRLLLNRFRSTITALLQQGDSVEDLHGAFDRAATWLNKLQQRGKIASYIVLEEHQALIEELLAQPSSTPRRVLVAIAIPKSLGVTLGHRTLNDMLHGVAARIVIAPQSAGSDPRTTLAVTAWLADALGTPMAHLDEHDIHAALSQETSADAARECLVHTYRSRHWQQVAAFDEGFELLINAQGVLTLQAATPERLTQPEVVAALEGALAKALLDEDLALSHGEITAVMGRFLTVLDDAKFHARHREQGARWRLWQPQDDLSQVGAAHGTSRASRQAAFAVTTNISADAMEWRIQGAVNLDAEAPPSLEQIRRAVRAAGIRTPLDESLDLIRSQIVAHQPIAGVVIAKGRLSTPPQGAFLRHAMQDEDTSSTDLRKRQAKRFASAGELIAVVAFTEPGQPGADVHGRPLAPGRAEADDFVAGEGVERRGARFFATTAGAIVLAGKAVTIQAALKIQGNVDLVSGDIRAPGPLDISGSVEAGASVEAQGAVHVLQQFSGKYLRARGGLIIGGGIAAKPSSRVVVHGDVHIKFMQEGQLRCFGNVTIESNMTGGIIEADGDVTVLSPQGGIFGGLVIAGGSVEAANLGRDFGPPVSVSFGTEVQAARTRRLLLQRRKHLREWLESLERSGLAAAGRSGDRREDQRKTVRNKIKRLAHALAAIERRLVAGTVAGAGASNASVSVAQEIAVATHICRNGQCTVVQERLAAVEVVEANHEIVVRPLTTA